MRKHRACDGEDGPWESPAHVGHIGTLNEKEVPGVPCEKKRHPAGFCIDPRAYLRQGKRDRAGARKPRCRL